MITYETTTKHTIDRFEVSAEIDDVQDISHLDNYPDVNASDPEDRHAARADAIRKAQHGKTWGMVTVIVRSQPDNVVRAVLGGVEAFNSATYVNYPRRSVIYSEATERRAENAAECFGEILSELVEEARDAVVDYVSDETQSESDLAGTRGMVESLPVVDYATNGPVDGAAVRDIAATAVDWWTRP